jgi:periplasmic protein CpxP/Spy
MFTTLANRTAPLLIATMLTSAAWAQSASMPAGPSPTTPSVTSGPTASGPTGTAHEAMPRNRRPAAAQQPNETMQNLAERRISDLHSRLHITADQSPQWDQFAQIMRQNATEMDQSNQQRAEKLGSMSAVDNMQSFAQLEQQRAQAMQRLVPAFQALYATLSDQQKATADQLFRNYASSARARHQAAAR